MPDPSLQTHGPVITSVGPTRDPRKSDPMKDITKLQGDIDRIQRAERSRGHVTQTEILLLHDLGADPSPPSEGSLIYNKGGATYVISAAGTITQIAPL